MQNDLYKFICCILIQIFNKNALLDILFDVVHYLHVHVEIGLHQLLQHQLRLLVLGTILCHKSHAELF